MEQTSTTLCAASATLRSPRSSLLGWTTRRTARCRESPGTPQLPGSSSLLSRSCSPALPTEGTPGLPDPLQLLPGVDSQQARGGGCCLMDTVPWGRHEPIRSPPWPFLVFFPVAEVTCPGLEPVSGWCFPRGEEGRTKPQAVVTRCCWLLPPSWLSLLGFCSCWEVLEPCFHRGSIAVHRGWPGIQPSTPAFCAENPSYAPAMTFRTGLVFQWSHWPCGGSAPGV